MSLPARLRSSTRSYFQLSKLLRHDITVPARCICLTLWIRQINTLHTHTEREMNSFYHPMDSRRRLQPDLDQISSTKARTVVCQLHLIPQADTRRDTDWYSP